MTAIQSGKHYLGELVKALGLENQLVNKLVLECDVKGILTVYVKGFVKQEQGAKILDVVRLVQCDEVRVKDDATVEADNPVVVQGQRTGIDTSGFLTLDSTSGSWYRCKHCGETYLVSGYDTAQCPTCHSSWGEKVPASQ